MDIKEVEKEYCSRCPSYKYGCGFITRGLQDKCVQLSDYVDGYERGYEQAKKEMIEKTLDFLKDKLYESGYIGIMDLCDEYIKAMKDET